MALAGMEAWLPRLEEAQVWSIRVHAVHANIIEAFREVF